MSENSFVHYLTKVLLEVMFYGGIACCLAVPFLAPKAMLYLNYREEIILPLTLVLLSSGLCALYIVWHLKSMFKTLIGGNPFIDKNVSSLRKCAVASFVIAIISMLDMIVGVTITAFLLIIIFSLLGLFCLTLKDLFKRAIAYKEENDWTV